MCLTVLMLDVCMHVVVDLESLEIFVEGMPISCNKTCS